MLDYELVWLKADHRSWNLLFLAGCVGRGRSVQNRCVGVGSLWAEREGRGGGGEGGGGGGCGQ